MRYMFASVLSAFVAGAALAQGLPSSVADAYRGYEAAVDAEDFELAGTFAYTAWQEAENYTVDEETITLLAANYGEIALLTGHHAAAATAYERALELMGSRHDDVARLGEYSRLAAQGHFANGDFRQARDAAERAVDYFEELPRSSEHFSGLYYSNMLLAFSFLQDRNTLRGGRFALRAMEALAEVGVVVSHDTASLTFMAAMNRVMGNDFENAAYYFTLSSYINDQIGSGVEASNIARAWSQYLRSELSPRERAELLRRLQNSGYRPPDCAIENADCFGESDWAEVYGPDAVVVDAEPESRIAPRYPTEAAMAGLEGLALVEYTIDREGRATDMSVVFSVPHSSFGEASVDVLRRWRFTPATVDGQPVDRPSRFTHFEFAMAD